MNATSRAMLCALVASVLCTGALLAGAEGRISGRVLDASGDPMQGVEVVLVSPQTGGEQSKTTDKKGKVVFLVLDATARYAVRITKEGYQPIQERIRPVVGSTLRKEWKLVPVSPSGGGGGGVVEGGEVRGKAGAIRLYNAGATASNEGDRATAIEKFREAIEVDPGFVPGHQALLGLYIQARDHTNALAVAEKLLDLAPTDTTALGARYDALVELQRSEEAEAALEGMILSAPGPAAAIRLFNRGATSLRESKVEEAIPDLKRALAMDPNLAVARSALAKVYLNRKEYRLAADNARILSDSNPEDAVALSILYDAFKGLGEAEKAEEAFAALEKISPERAAEAFYRQGVALLDQARHRDALASFERVLASYPGHLRVHYMLGLCYLNTGDMALAKTSLRKFLGLAPDDRDAPSAREMLAALE
ncbi:MAG: tetratricopeptide repeat protein [Acidobacteria bacterium]|nr:tetratricopeptide repeat protein [Acidobacteriota bacterium]